MNIIDHPTRHLTAAPDPARVTLPPINCTEWCRQGDGHPDHVLAADQTCMSGWPGDQTLTPDGAVSAYAVRTAGWPPAVAVAVELWDRGAREIMLTETEVRAHAAALLAAADLIADRPTSGGAA